MAAAATCLRRAWQLAFFARERALFSAGSSMLARIAMIAMTMRSSMRVKIRFFMGVFPLVVEGIDGLTEQCGTMGKWLVLLMDQLLLPAGIRIGLF